MSSSMSSAPSSMEGIDPPVPEDQETNDGSFIKIQYSSFLKCIMGCTFSETKEVIKLDCMHFICSDMCVQKLKMESETLQRKKLHCPKCCLIIEPNELSNKIVLGNVFIQKKCISGVKLSCGNCVQNRPAIAYCQNCEEDANGNLMLLCEKCAEGHLEAKKTHNHVLVQDLTKRKEKELEDEWTCKEHKCIRDSFCISCNLKICVNCRPVHQEHKILDIQNSRTELRAFLDIVRELGVQCDFAHADIVRKRANMFAVQWNDLKDRIDNEFSALVKILAERKCMVLQKARESFEEQVSTLDQRAQFSLCTKSSGENFIRMGKEVLDNRDAVAPAIFMWQYANYVKWQSEMAKNFMRYYDRYVEKNGYFQLDTSTQFQIQKNISEYCNVEYIHKPIRQDDSMNESMNVDTFVGNQESINEIESQSTRLESKNGNNELAGNLSETLNNANPLANNNYIGRKSKNISRRAVAVKSTACRQQVSTMSDHGNGEVSILRLSKTIVNKSAVVEDVASETEPGAVSNASAHEELFEFSSDDNVAARDKDTILAEMVGMERENEKDQSVNMETPATSTGGVHIGTACTVVPSTAVLGSEPRLGKRVRKKKRFPQYVYGNLTREMKSKTSASAPTRIKRKYTKSTASKKPRHQSEQEINKEDIQLALAQMDNEDWNPSESDYVTRDYYEPEPGPSNITYAYRRRAGKASANSSSRKNLRFDESVFPHVPESSLEIDTPVEYVFPILKTSEVKMPLVNAMEALCAICRVGSDDEPMACCDDCFKMFHFGCHLPALSLKDLSGDPVYWRCNYSTSKKMVDEEIASLPIVRPCDKKRLDNSNQRTYLLACKFMMECCKIPESETIRFFPKSYRAEFGKDPVHLKYIRERLVRGQPGYFTDVYDFLMSFLHSFTQAFRLYMPQESAVNEEATIDFFIKFLILVYTYYSEYRFMFEDLKIQMLLK